MDPKPVPTSADDIATLRERLQLPTLRYVDFDARHELQAAYRRWPLLREIHDWREGEAS